MLERVSIDEALGSYDLLLSGKLLGAQGDPTSALFVGGAPRSGKTRFAMSALRHAWHTGKDDGERGDIPGAPLHGIRPRALMVCSTRLSARELNAQMLPSLGHTSIPRVVTTLPAVAFSVLERSRAERGLTAPRLLNGAEQDALLTSVLDEHRRHARTGDLCPTCDLLVEYFGARDGIAARGDTASAATGFPEGESDRTVPYSGTSDEIFERCLTPAFTAQLRDMLARMNEVGARHARRDMIIDALGARPIDSDQRERLSLQWRLAFALRREYADAVVRRFPGEFRVDSSYLLVTATSQLRDHRESCLRAVPEILIVDDAQDVTIAGMEFVQELVAAGTRLVLVAGNDEAVQTFRGSYPEFLHRRVVMPSGTGAPDECGIAHGGLGRLGAAQIELAPLGDDSTVSDRDIVASRISLSIGSEEEGLAPMTDRTGKYPQYHGSLAVPPVSRACAECPEGEGSGNRGCRVAVETHRSPGAEMESVISHIIRTSMSGMTGGSSDRRDDGGLRPADDGGARVMWNDMAVIAHDNSTVRTYGARLRAMGVPVRYSSVTRSFGEDQTVQGLLSLLQLAMARLSGGSLPEPPSDGDAEADAETRYGTMARLLEEYLSSPLIGVPSGRDDVEGGRVRPVRMHAVRSALDAIRLMAVAVGEAGADQKTGRKINRRADRRTDQDQKDGAGHADGVQTPDPDSTASTSLRPLADLWNAAHESRASSTPVRHTTDEIVALLVCRAGAPSQGEGDPSADAADGVMAALKAMGRSLPDVRAVVHALSVIRAVADDLGNDRDVTPSSALWSAWDRSHVADSWQRAALGSGPDADLANDRLDMAVRLFDYAEHGSEARDLAAFIERVNGMDVVADSLARTAPVDDAVTLTTPAGAVGREWRYVWIPAVQQDVWPNLTIRNTLFGADDLADLMLRGRMPALEDAQGDRSRLLSVLHAEQRSLLVALTRASDQVVLSAVSGGDAMPSDFLRVYLPEFFQSAANDDASGGVPHSVRGGSEDITGVDAPADGDPMEDGPAGDDAAADTVADDRRAICGALARSVSGSVTPRGLVREARMVVTSEAVREMDAVGTRTDGRRTAGGRGDEFHRDADVRTHVARVPLPDEVRDAVGALSALSREGSRGRYPMADPRNWFFVDASRSDAFRSALHDSVPSGPVSSDSARGPADSASDGGHGSRDVVVPLSPSIVDSVWACPVCALLDRSMSGPTVSGVSMSFGTIVHHVAQWGSEQGLDRPVRVGAQEGTPGTSETDDQRIDAIAGRLTDRYRDLRGPLDAASDPSSAIAIRRKDAAASGIMANLAGYFVRGNGKDYGSKVGARIGDVVDVGCEVPLTSRFGLDDITAAYNAIPGTLPMTRDEMFMILGELAGGFPSDFSPDAVIRLSARIDRLERRRDAQGEFLRVIDYKTGMTKHTGAQNFCDLQLVCYQLALRFADEGDWASRPVAGASLFDVATHDAPGQEASVEEKTTQPPLFVDGHLNAGRARPANLKPKPGDDRTVVDRYFPDAPEPSSRPDDVREEVWSRLLAYRDAKSYVFWGLSMISRVFYAAAVMSSASIPPHDPASGHLRYCEYRNLCSWCADGVITVMGREQD